MTVSESDTEEYKDPEPEKITSLCYSCDRYEDCTARNSLCTSCNTYEVPSRRGLDRNRSGLIPGSGPSSPLTQGTG